MPNRQQKQKEKEARTKARAVASLLVKPESAEDGLRQIQDGDDFVLHLLGKAEDVGVILCKAPDAHQSVQRAAALIAVYCTKLGPSNRKVSEERTVR